MIDIDELETCIGPWYTPSTKMGIAGLLWCDHDFSWCDLHAALLDAAQCARSMPEGSRRDRLLSVIDEMDSIAVSEIVFRAMRNSGWRMCGPDEQMGWYRPRPSSRPSALPECTEQLRARALFKIQ